MEWLTDRPIAHRGLHSDGVPENSLPAFVAAREAGYPAELDVRLSADGVPVVFHDATLDRLTDRSGSVGDRRWDELTACRLAESDCRPPRLEEVLEAIDGEVGLLIELKTDGRPGALEQTVADALDGYAGPFAVQSFNPLTVWWLRRHRPSWLRGQLAGLGPAHPAGALRRRVLNRLLPNLATRPDFVGYNHQQLPSPPVARSRERGRPVLAWTVRDEATERRLEPFADNVIFEAFTPPRA